MKLIFLALSTILIYLPSLSSHYIWDDNLYVLENPHLSDFSGLKEIWFNFAANPQYYPLVFTSFWLEKSFWDLNPTGFHLTNILLHASSTLLLYRLLQILKVPGTFLAALLFAIHPIQVESVSWITERKNVLSGFFYFLSLISYFSWRPASSNQGFKFNKYYVLSFFFFLLALFSKTVTCSLPAVILLIIWWKRGNITSKNIFPLIPFFIAGISSGLLTAWIEKFHAGADGFEWELSFAERFLIAGRALCFYLGKIVWPHPLIFIYPRWEIDSGALWQYLFPLAILALTVNLFIKRDTMGRGPLVALLFFMGTLFPALGFFDVYPMRFSFVADHFQYLALIGPLIMIASGLSWLQVAPAAYRFIAAFLFISLASLTWHNQKKYQNYETLWQDTIKKNPASWMAHNNLAGHYLKNPLKLTSAEEHLKHALQIKPGYPEAQYNLGKVYQAQKRYDLATQQYLSFLSNKPKDYETHNNLGQIYSFQKKYSQAITYFEKAIHLNPQNVKAHNNLGNTYQLMKKFDQAKEAYRQALKQNPRHFSACINLGNILSQEGKKNEAIAYFQLSTKIKPQSELGYFFLARELEKLGNHKEAYSYFEKVISLKPHSEFAKISASAMQAIK